MDMIFTDLKKHSHYKDEILKEIESAFHYNDENSFAVDFYQLIKESNHPNCHILLDDNKKLLAHIGVRPISLHYKGVELNTLLLGGIVTKKEHQGKGYFRKLYEHIVELYKDKFSLIILWSDMNDFYQRLGFNQFGLTAVVGDVPVTYDDILKRGFKEENINKQDLSIISEKYNQSYSDIITVKRTIRDWEDIRMTSSMKFFKNNAGEYLFFEKGQDLKGIIHETSFSSNKDQLEKFHSLQLLNPFALDDKSFFIHLAWGKIINLNLFSEFINKISNRAVKIRDNELQIKNNSYKVQTNDLLTTLFGPDKAQEVETIIPPIYITGADSI